jgi:hypothetical protein
MIEFLRSQACLLVDGCDMHIIPYKGNSGHYRVQILALLQSYLQWSSMRHCYSPAPERLDARHSLFVIQRYGALPHPPRILCHLHDFEPARDGRIKAVQPHMVCYKHENAH